MHVTKVICILLKTIFMGCCMDGIISQAPSFNMTLFTDHIMGPTWKQTLNLISNPNIT